MFTDFKQALRFLSKAPAFTILIVTVLMLGIGANTAMFSVVNGVLLKPLPFAGADRLVAIDTTVRNEPDDTAYLDFLDWRAQATTLEHMAAYSTAGVTLTGRGDAASVNMAVVTADLFPLLGVAPIRGRTLTAEDDARGAPRRAVISEKLWAARFSRDEAAIGSTAVLDGDPVTIVGVMPASFEFPFDGGDEGAQLWMPILASRFATEWADQRGASFLKGIGKLRPGVKVATAQQELVLVAKRVNDANPREGSTARGIVVRPFHDVLVRDYRLALIVLLTAVAAVLLIACANVANLLLARGTTRGREIAVRVALGASRGRIVRQLLAESLLLAVAGGVGGCVLALWAVDLLVRVSPVQIPRLHAVHVDRAVLAFSIGASLLTGALCGLVPALQLSRTNAVDALKDGDRGGSNGGRRTRQLLVVAEVAMSLVLLAAAGLLTRSLLSLQRVSPGFVVERAVAMQLLLPQTRYANAAAMTAFYRRLRNNLRTLPNVTASAVSTTLPMTGSDIDMGFRVEGRALDPNLRDTANFFGISPEYFRAMGIPITKGRRFTERDDEKAPPVVVINEAMAAKSFAGENPIGKQLRIDYNRTGRREIVGVAANVKQTTLAAGAVPQMYTPFVQAPWPFITAVVRTTGAPDAAASSLRRVLAVLDPQQAPGEVKTLEHYVQRSIATPRFTAVLIGGFATLALLLAAFGLYGVMAYAVVQRRREIGIRMALGAQPADVRSLVVMQAVALGGAGVAAGLAGALAMTRVLTSLLFGVSASDPLTFAAVSALLLAVILAAAYLPARRATAVDPMIALRAE